jgi:8-oxo-dGTP diphosphatase
MAKAAEEGEYRRPVSVETVLFSVPDLARPELHVLLRESGAGTATAGAGEWALPGGPLKPGEGLAGAAAHRLEERTGINGVFLHQAAAVGTPGRDPGAESVAILHFGLVGSGQHLAPVTPDARPARWFPADAVAEGQPVPPTGQALALALDHRTLVGMALESLRRSAGETPAVFDLLPAEFTFTEMQSLFEAVLGKEMDRRNFRRKVKELALVSKARGTRRSGAHRPARLYRFNPKAFEKWTGREAAWPFR